MSARWAALLTLVMLATNAQAQPALRAQSVLAHCAAQAPSVRGLNALRAACPGIGRAITRLGLDRQLPAGWRQRVTPSDLGGLDRLTQRYSGRPPRVLSAAPLRAIARALKPPHPAPDAWDAIMAWMHRLVAPLILRMRRWLHALPGGSAHVHLGRHILLYVLAAAVLSLLLVLGVHELRAAGKRRRGRSKRSPASDGPAMAAAPAAETTPDWNELGSHPAGWLRALVSALTASRRLELERALTCRELAAHARFDSEAQHADFKQIVMLAEHELYGPDGPGPISQQMRTRARTLHAELSREPTDIEARRR